MAETATQNGCYAPRNQQQTELHASAESAIGVSFRCSRSYLTRPMLPVTVLAPVRNCERPGLTGAPGRSFASMIRALACLYVARSEGLEPPTS
jgi:hypothetical protein